MKSTVPYLRQRSDSFWEIVFSDPQTGKSRRKSTKTKDQHEAALKLDEFTSDKGASAPRAGEPRLRRRKDGYWETAYKDGAGKARRKGHGTKLEREGEERHAIFLKELARPEIPTRPTVGWILDQYYSYICSEKAESTAGPMAANIGPLKECLGHLHWDDVLQDTVDDYVEWRMSRPRWTSHQDFDGQYGRTSRNTACKDLRVLRAAMNRARKNRYTSAPADFSIVEGEPVRDTKSWLTKEEMGRMLAACEPRPISVNGKEIDRDLDREHIAAFLLISLATGARKEAILSLTWDQIYIPEAQLKLVQKLPAVFEGEHGPYTLLPAPIFDEDGNVHYPKSAQRFTGEEPLNLATGEHVSGAYIDFGEGNGKKRRPAIPVGKNPRLMQYLLYGGDRSQPYVISRHGKPIESLKHGLATVAKEAGVKKLVTHHTMKRTAITHMVRAQVPFNIIAEAVNTTEEVLKKHYSMHRPDIEAALGGALSLD